MPSGVVGELDSAMVYATVMFLLYAAVVSKERGGGAA